MIEKMSYYGCAYHCLDMEYLELVRWLENGSYNRRCMERSIKLDRDMNPYSERKGIKGDYFI